MTAAVCSAPSGVLNLRTVRVAIIYPPRSLSVALTSETPLARISPLHAWLVLPDRRAQAPSSAQRHIHAPGSHGALRPGYQPRASVRMRASSVGSFAVTTGVAARGLSFADGRRTRRGRPGRHPCDA